MYQPGRLVKGTGAILMVAGSLWFLLSLALRTPLPEVFEGVLPAQNGTQQEIPKILGQVYSQLTKRRPQDVAPIAASIFVVGMIIWWIGHERGLRYRQGRLGKVEVVALEDTSEETRNDMLALCEQYPGLPPVPFDPLQFGAWIEEAHTRTRSLGLGAAQETNLRDQLNALREAWLANIDTEAQLRQALADLAIVKMDAERRAESADKTEAKEAELYLANIEERMAKIETQIKDLKKIRRHLAVAPDEPIKP